MDLSEEIVWWHINSWGILHKTWKLGNESVLCGKNINKWLINFWQALMRKKRKSKCSEVSGKDAENPGLGKNAELEKKCGT